VGKKERKKRLQGSLSLPSKKGMLANSLLLWGKKKKKRCIFTQHLHKDGFDGMWVVRQLNSA